MTNIAAYSLEDVLHPRSVAILGASRASHKWGNVVAKQLMAGGFAGLAEVVSDHGAGDGAGHHHSVGGPHGDGRDVQYGPPGPFSLSR